MGGGGGVVSDPVVPAAPCDRANTGMRSPAGMGFSGAAISRLLAWGYCKTVSVNNVYDADPSAKISITSVPFQATITVWPWSL